MTRRVGLALSIGIAACSSAGIRRTAAPGQAPRWPRASPRKRVLAWADTRNGQAQHESIGHALAIIERLGYESGMWDTFIRTDSNVISKNPKKTDGTPASGGPSLSNVDAIFFAGHREVALDASQKEELLQFVREGHGFVAAHVGLTAFESWPEFGELIGARFDGHPIVGDGIVINENPAFPATKHLPAAFAFNDEFYQPSRVLARHDRRSAAAGREAGRPPRPRGRRLSAGVGEDVRQGPRVLRIVCPRERHLGHPRRPADVLRGAALVPGLDRRRAAPHPLRGSAADLPPQRGRGRGEPR